LTTNKYTQQQNCLFLPNENPNCQRTLRCCGEPKAQSQRRLIAAFTFQL